MVGLEAREVLLDAVACCHREAADPVGIGRDEIGQAHIGPRRALLDLLAQEVEPRHFLGAPLVGEQNDVVAVAPARPEADHALGGQPLLAHDVLQHLARVGVELFSAFAHHLVLEDGGIIAGQLPGAEERRPVDALDQLVQGILGEDARAPDGRLGRRVGRPVHLEVVGARRRERHDLFLGAAGAFDPDCLVLVGHLGGEVGGLRARFGDQRGAHADRARGVEHMHGRALVAWRDAQRRVDLRRRGPADQQRQLEALPRHLLGHGHHLVERRRDQA